MSEAAPADPGTQHPAVLEEACTPPADLPEHGALAHDLVVARTVRAEAMTTVASIFG
jgi:hypothetical protein